MTTRFPASEFYYLPLSLRQGSSSFLNRCFVSG